MALVRGVLAAEATRNLSDLFRRAASYFEAHRRFPPPVGPTPERLCGTPDGRNHPQPGWWEHPTWTALGFRLDRPFYYRYSFEARGEGPGAAFVIRAEGDLDCNGVRSRFEQRGVVALDGTVTDGGLQVVREQE